MIKNIVYKSLCLVLLIALVSCSQEEPINESNSKTPLRCMNDFKFWGQAHNGFLDDALENYQGEEATKAIGDEDARPNYEALNTAQINYARTLNLPSDEEESLCTALEEYKPFYEPDKCFNDYFVNKTSNIPVIQQRINYLFSVHAIDSFEHTLLTSLITDVIKFENDILQWNDYYGYLTDDSKGQLSAYILSITDASFSWWSENNVTGTRLAPWIATDAAGAIVGGGVNAATQYIKHGRIKNWKTVGYNALASGVVASTGVVGKLAKWFVRI